LSSLTLINWRQLWGLGLVEEKLKGNISKKKLTYWSEREKEEVEHKCSRNKTSESSEDGKRQKRKEDTRNIIAQARVNNSRYAWREENYEDDKKRDGRAMLYPQGSQNTSTQRI
jgi:hypothetical protein